MKKEKKLKRVSDGELKLIEAIRLYGEPYVINVLKKASIDDETGVLRSLMLALLPFRFYTLSDLVAEGAVSQNDAEDARSAIKDGRSIVVTGGENAVLLVQALLWESVLLDKGRVVTLETEPSIDLRSVDMNEATESYLVQHLSYLQFADVLEQEWGYVGVGTINSKAMLSILEGVLMSSKSAVFNVPCENSETLEEYLSTISGHNFLIGDTESWKDLIVFETHLTGIEVTFSLERY